MASTIMARSWPTTQARNVAPRSSRIRAATGRCLGETSNRIPSRYRRGWRARYRAMTTTLAPSTNSLPPAVTYGRIDPRRKPAASSIRLATTPDSGLASSVFRSTGYSRAQRAISFWMLVSVWGSQEGADPHHRRERREHRGGEPKAARQSKAPLQHISDGREVDGAQRGDEDEEQHLDHPNDEPDGQGGNEERHERGARQPGSGRRLSVQWWRSGGGGASSSSTSSASAAPLPSCFD